MAYRSLLVVLDGHPLCTARTDLAVRLARQLQAHLVGLAPTAHRMGDRVLVAWDDSREAHAP